MTGGTFNRIAARSAQEYVAEKLSVPLYRAYHLLAEANVRPFRDGMRYWYLRHEIDMWIERQAAQR